MDSIIKPIEKHPGLNIQAPWARLLVEGKKTIETRTYPLPEKFKGQDLWLIETPGKLGTFKARVIGIIQFSDCRRYLSATEFYADCDLHLVTQSDRDYSWRPDKPKFGWLVSNVRKVGAFDAPAPRGIVYCKPFSNAALETP